MSGGSRSPHSKTSLSRLRGALRRAAAVASAQAQLTLYWYKENKLMLFLQVAWPYMTVFIVLGLGSAYGSVERFASSMGVSKPFLYVVSASFVAFAAVGVIDSTSNAVLWHRWLGTLPYVALAPNSLTLYVTVSGLVASLIGSGVILAALAPAALVLAGIPGLAGLGLVAAFLVLGLVPLIAIAGISASLTLASREETGILSFLNPLLLLVSGVFYPVEVLPRLLRAVSEATPVTYVVEASRIIAGSETPGGRAAYAVALALAVLALVYNSIFTPVASASERVLRRRGVE